MNCVVVGDDSGYDSGGTFTAGDDDDDDDGDWLWWSLFWLDHITRAVFFVKIAYFVDNLYTFVVFWRKESVREDNNVCGYKIMSTAFIVRTMCFVCTLPCQIS